MGCIGQRTHWYRSPEAFFWPKEIPKCVVLLAVFASMTLGSGAFAQTTLEHVPGEVIVKLRGKAKSIHSQAFIGKAVSEKAMSLKGSWAGLNTHHFALKPGQSVEAVIAELKADPSVEYAEPNYIVRRQNVGGVEGPLVSMRTVYELAASGPTAMAGSPVTTAPIQSSAAWAEMTPGKAPPIVAVIDTGVDLSHDVFVNSGAIWINDDEIAGNGIDDDGNGYVDDIHGWNFNANNNDPQDDEGHGTHVAGIVLGTTQDIMASPIAAAQIRIMPLKFLDSEGAGTTSDAIKAIYYAVNNGAKVLNNSWGGGGFSQALVDAINYSYQNGRVFVAAAGNSANNNDSNPTYPANYSVPNVMSIAATSDTDGWASFSNFGVQTVHIGSPGVSIRSTYPGNNLARLSGTSMATPFVSGVAALMVREQPQMNGYQVKSLLFGGTVHVSSLVGKTVYQSRLNVYNALLSAKGSTVNENLPAYDLNSVRGPSSVASGGMGAGCGLVKSISDSGEGGMGPGQGKNLQFLFVIAVMLAPVLLSLALRRRTGRQQRRYTRYQIDSSVRLRIGDKELVGQVSTISLGGVQLNTDAWLEKGGLIKMQIQSPDGADNVEVEGRIVWSEEHKRYGVAFANATPTVTAAISRWTQSLLKA